MQSKKIKLGLFGIGHLIIDLVGIYILFYQYHHLSFANITLYFILYNLLAFGMQVVFGYYADKYKLYKLFLVLPFLFASMALLLYEIGIIPILIMTLANAMIHVGGGVLSVDMFKGKSMPAGVFVAPGVIGVFAGGILALNEVPVTIFLLPIVVLMFLLNYFVMQAHVHTEEQSNFPDNLLKLIGFILIIIAIRAFLGSVFVMEWNDSNLMQFFLILSIFLGKFLGGIFGDRFGFKKVGVYGLIFSLPFLMLGKQYMIFGLIGAFLFNSTMAITLFLIMDILKPYKGFAFGLTTLTLVIFFLPSQFGLELSNILFYYSVTIVGVLLAAYILSETLKIYERR